MQQKELPHSDDDEQASIEEEEEEEEDSNASFVKSREHSRGE